LAYWPYDDIKAWVTHKEKLKVNQGGRTFGDMKVRGLLGLAWWVTDHVRRGESIDLTKFDEGVMRTSMIEARVERDAH
jgi:hypothetical protein